jgi:hypothetical protein
MAWSFLGGVSLMPRDGATIFSDLTGKLDLLRVACDNERHGLAAPAID